ncbi:MAG: hypothetical protein WC069_03815 [Candidatus Shapirobacteria bacterium]
MKITLLIGLTLINLLWSINFSAGDRYVAKLNRWYELAMENKWSQAASLEKSIDPADILWFKEKYKAENLKKRLNELMIKDNKSADDWMVIAQIQSGINKEEMKRAIERAHQIDPIRLDIEKIYFSSFL